MTTRFFRFSAVILFQLAFSAGLFAQDPNLANQYFTDGEYEKAATLYEQLSESDPRSEYYFNRYVDCLLNLERYDESEKAVKKQLKRTPDNANIYVVYGNIFDRQGKTEEAKAQYTKAVNAVAPDYAAVNRLATTFINAAKYDFAIQTYERGSTLLNDPNRFAFNLGELYRRKGDMPKMIEYYLNAISVDPGRLGYVQTLLAKNLGDGDYTELQSQLYARLQQKETPEFVELLAWSFVQRKDFKSALRQYKALDKRLGEVGQRVYKLAGDAAAAHDYETAIAAYDYIITEKGPTNPYFFDAKREAMNCRRDKITEGYTYTTEDLKLLETDYEQFLAQFGGGRNTASITLQLAELEALYMNNLPKAIALLDHLREEPGLDPVMLARVKINLADYYLMSGERWESTLLYSQVDKDFKEGQIGQEARFKKCTPGLFHGRFSVGTSAVRRIESLHIQTDRQRRARPLGVHHGQPQPRHHGRRHQPLRRRRTDGVPEPLRRRLRAPRYAAPPVSRTLAARRRIVPGSPDLREKTRLRPRPRPLPPGRGKRHGRHSGRQFALRHGPVVRNPPERP